MSGWRSFWTSSQLDKASQSSSDFLVWTINQKEGINAALIAQRLEEVRKKQKKFIV